MIPRRGSRLALLASLSCNPLFAPTGGGVCYLLGDLGEENRASAVQHCVLGACALASCAHLVSAYG
jgi:hypothetical protein